MIPVPTRNILILLFIPLIILLAGLINPYLISIAVFLDIIILITGLADIINSIRKIDFSHEVELRKIFSIGRNNHLDIFITNRCSKVFNISLIIDIPESWEDLSNITAIPVAPYEKRKYSLIFNPKRRGLFKIDNLYARHTTLFGLFTINKKIKIQLEVEVFPDIKELNQYMHMARQNRLSDIGIHKSRYTGIGTELEYLREYQKDDDSKNIEWKVTKRINKPVTKVFQMETSNVITFAVDCGRLMTAEQEGISSLDYAVNALLILSHMSLKMGDTINIIAYSDTIIGELSNVKGKYAIRKVNHFLTKLKPDFVESNYKRAFEYIKKRIKKRSLIIFFTDIIDDINYQIFKRYLALLNKRHLTLFILLRDYLLMKSVKLEPDNVDDLYTSATAKDMFLKRSNTISKLRLNKINVLDVLPKQTTPRLIDKYLEIKSRNFL